MTPWTLIVALAVLVGGSLPQAPTPRVLTDAKTAWLFNHRTDGALFDRFAREIEKAGAFTLVGDSTDADVYVFLSHLSGGRAVVPLPGGGFVDSDTGTLYVHVYPKGAEPDSLPLWTDRESLGVFAPGGGAANLAKRLSAAVLRTRKRTP